MPASIWAKVPQKTRIMPSTNRMTVSRSDARTERPRPRSDRRDRLEGSTTSRDMASADARAVSTALTTIGSCRAGEFERAHERLEGGLVSLDKVGGSPHLDEPGLAAARHNDGQGALRRSAGAEQVHV